MSFFFLFPFCVYARMCAYVYLHVYMSACAVIITITITIIIAIIIIIIIIIFLFGLLFRLKHDASDLQKYVCVYVLVFVFVFVCTSSRMLVRFHFIFTFFIIFFSYSLLSGASAPFCVVFSYFFLFLIIVIINKFRCLSRNNLYLLFCVVIFLPPLPSLPFPSLPSFFSFSIFTSIAHIHRWFFSAGVDLTALLCAPHFFLFFSFATICTGGSFVPLLLLFGFNLFCLCVSVCLFFSFFC
ncbi:T. brucei spp.-specific protein [Trypanosoma brucei gambiense DAL972]|uniref:Uncharacterized protein n=1 Tax=Trypanosoma brucei gambiense (strain MHOM/CI/86/DAL972) TaxID=679716 RepID=D0AAS2_TRYB9|nr:T. brucei spp.-specific protein [Trypanosoma brucei gambiense DAL972]CBH18773.1 T. brucei spp.-specific protein [Trypanosoma brucei gambiense DAL972]|eukprot:XP_011781037.1 T. brucei spp.-specific protein [Trypanosoma brucei gambiense DAL972]